MQGPYLSAFGKMFNVLEDSGWELKRSDDEDDSHAEGPSSSESYMSG